MMTAQLPGRPGAACSARDEARKYANDSCKDSKQDLDKDCFHIREERRENGPDKRQSGNDHDNRKRPHNCQPYLIRHALIWEEASCDLLLLFGGKASDGSVGDFRLDRATSTLHRRGDDVA